MEIRDAELFSFGGYTWEHTCKDNTNNTDQIIHHHNQSSIIIIQIIQIIIILILSPLKSSGSLFWHWIVCWVLR